MKHFFIVAALFLGLVSCSEEQDLVIVEPLLINVLDDEVYSQIDQNDFKSYIRAFIKDAERHGVDLSNVNIDSAVLELKEPGEDYASGAAALFCDPDNVYIIWNTRAWNNDKLSNTNIVKLVFFWHELGHDILGLDHTCTNGHIMTSRNSQCIVPEDEVREVNLWNLRYNDPTPLKNFQRAVDDMFGMVDQVRFDCRTSFTSKGQTEILSCNMNF